MKMIYGSAWKKDIKQLCRNSNCSKKTCAHHFGSSPVTLIDLRSSRDFDEGHIAGSISASLPNLSAATPSPFDDTTTLCILWKDLKAMFSDREDRRRLDSTSNPVIVICYQGEASRLATAILRGQDIEAYSVYEGIVAISQVCKDTSRNGLG